ncbi:hypothetical protein TCAL_14643 [Tigriopus californicus]|uniref:Uncharacterized protein n=1 Tax=Tigriopus californicus TaxID=6832 RepID=A0A553P6E9_TIGCA|nr:hypothetical protein TCAL_14643 [Tigriopus californicus]
MSMRVQIDQEGVSILAKSVAVSESDGMSTLIAGLKQIQSEVNVQLTTLVERERSQSPHVEPLEDQLEDLDQDHEDSSDQEEKSSPGHVAKRLKC